MRNATYSKKSGRDNKGDSATTERRVTLKQVAEIAGVSVSTASLVLAGKGAARRISAQVESRVREVALEQDYSPNLLVRSIQQGRTGILSFYSAFHKREMDDLYMDRLSAAAERAAGRRGYNLLVYCDFTRPADEVYRALNGGQADGLLFFGPNEGDPLLALLRRSRLPTVVLNHAEADGGLPYVTDDMEDGIRQVADALIARGHRRIAAVVGPPVLGADAPLRIRLLRGFLGAQGVTIPDRWLLPVFDGGMAPETALRILLDEPEPPTALFCWHDRIGYRILEACDALGVSVPERLSLIGYDGLHWPSTSRHILASVKVDLEALAEAAVEHLDDLVRGETGDFHRVFPVALDAGSTLGFGPFYRSDA